MGNKLVKGVLTFAAGAAVGAAGAMWLMSDSGKEVRDELNKLATQAKDKFKEYCEQLNQQMTQQVQKEPAEQEPTANA